MLRNYLTTAYRNLLRHKVFSLINILGLAIGMAACLLILRYTSFELSYDDFHKKGKQIYRVSVDGIRDGKVWVEDACGFNVSGAVMQKEFPEVEDYTHIRLAEKAVLSQGNIRFREAKVGLASPHFFTLFTFPLLKGNPETALEKPNTVVISQSAAQKYFGKNEPLGKLLQYQDNYHQEQLIVTGVMQDMPANSHLHLDFVISYSTSQGWAGWDIRWGGNNDYVYVLLDEKANAKILAAKMPAFSRRYLKGPGNEDLQMEIQPLQDIHLYSNKTFEAEPNGSAVVVYMLLGVGIFILIIACVNYINLATARSVERAKEVGIRKVIGSQRSHIIQQFLLESLLLNVLALVLAITMVQLLLPLFDSLTGKPVSDHSLEIHFRLGWIGVFIAAACLSGLYPAIVLSAFKPISILKGRFSHSRQGIVLRKSLVIFQFVAGIVLVTGTFTVYKQLGFMQHKDLGMNIDQTLVVYAPGIIGNDSIADGKYTSLKSQLKQLASIRHVSVTECLPGNGMYELNSATGYIKRLEDPNPSPPRYFLYTIDEEFVPTLGMKLLAGRSSYAATENNHDKMIINEAALHQLGFSTPEEAINQRVKWFDETREIIGVVANYHHHSLDKGYDPMLLCFEGNYRDASYIAIRLNRPQGQQGGAAATIAQVKEVWNSIFPASTFSYFFMDEQFNSQYQAYQQFRKVFSIFACLAIFVACLGLYGMSSFSITQRTKEVGVRKVLGASITHIVALLSKDFIKLVLLANLIAWPLAYWGISKWLENYAFRIDINIWLFIIPALLVLVIALLTVSIQTIKAARANPVKALKYE